MIQSFRNTANGKALEAFYTNGSTRRLSIQNTARLTRILQALANAKYPGQLAEVLPNYRFHSLGEMAPGRYALEASANWRLTFAWEGENAVELDLEDYH